jgi:ADP-ribosyl-[dinitrogen reductase] hydrolase
MPTEFLPRRYRGTVRGYEPGRLPAGTFTDDTETALALGEALRRDRSLRPRTVISRLLAWRESNPPDIGIQTSSALAIHRSAPPEQPVRKTCSQIRRRAPDSAGNGSIIRLWPVALAYRHAPARLRRSAAWRQGRLTHGARDCRACEEVLVNLLVSLIAGMELHRAIRKAVKRFPRLSFTEETFGTISSGGGCVDSLRAALWCCQNSSSFSDAVTTAAALGNDSDSVAAIAGAIAGAYYGANAIPQELLSGLRGNLCGISYDWEEIARLALSLARLRPRR